MMSDEDCKKLDKQIEKLKKENEQLKQKVKDKDEISQGHRKIIGDTYKEVDTLKKDLDKSKQRECKCNTETLTSS
tara:strand:- start:95 stop:319 length:225 start_codon:yes stop_codon:yes gene_type:complete